MNTEKEKTRNKILQKHCLHHNYKMVGEYSHIFYCKDCGYEIDMNKIF